MSKPADAGFVLRGYMTKLTDEEPIAPLRISADRPISTQIYEFLRRQITMTAIKPGRAISENELSAHFAVSRQPVREALMRLRHDGLLHVIPQRGSIVQKISVSNLRQICFLRSAIECAAIDAAQKLDDQRFELILGKLKENLKEQQELMNGGTRESTAAFLQADDKFHHLLCSLSTCPMAWDTIQSIKPQMDRIRYLSQGRVSPYEQLIDEHQSIFEALEERQFALAREYLTLHLHEIMQTYIAIREQYGQWFLPEEEELTPENM